MKLFESKPAAYRVFCPIGHEYDYIICHDMIERNTLIEELKQDYPNYKPEWESLHVKIKRNRKKNI